MCLAGLLPPQSGERVADERLRLGVFAQDLAQELPQEEVALSYVESTVRAFDGTITSERCRSVMGSLGLVGEKSTRPIGTLSGGEKARLRLRNHIICFGLCHGRDLAACPAENQVMVWRNQKVSKFDKIQVSKILKPVMFCHL